ncbi:hypothetical protein J2S05_003437 [Alkalicoccobacillus murimartini]|uniref:Uncharacterized protein n=1 Tax=Alkalicoccobacillus murimartini TaxID=171685 RepID=A0ABT9YL95_9BACI|nr:hypothetical protein [Alkalicoccobacillus murimartini]
MCLENKRHITVSLKYANKLIKLGELEMNIEEMKKINNRVQVLIDLVES